MADYTKTTWVDDDGSGAVGTVFNAARMNQLEAAAEDAAEHNKRGTLGTRPAAAAANKNWLWIDQDSGEITYSDGTNWHAYGGAHEWQPVELSSSSNINIASAPANLDGVAGVAAGTRVLLYGQTTSSQNGLYIHNGAGVAMTRAADAADSRQFRQNKQVLVRGGGNAGRAFYFTPASLPTIGTTSLLFRGMPTEADITLLGTRLDTIATGRRLVPFSAATQVDIDNLNPTVTQAIRLSIFGSTDAAPADNSRCLMLPNKVATDPSEAHIIGSFDSGVANNYTAHQQSFNGAGGGVLLWRTYNATRQSFQATSLIPLLVPNGHPQMVYSGHFSVRRSGGNWQHLGGLTHGLWESNSDVSSGRILFPSASTGFLVIESLSGEGL